MWKLYHRALGIAIGAYQKLREIPNIQDPRVRPELERRYRKRGLVVPWDQKVITPAAMFASELLITAG